MKVEWKAGRCDLVCQQAGGIELLFFDRQPTARLKELLCGPIVAAIAAHKSGCFKLLNLDCFNQIVWSPPHTGEADIGSYSVLSLLLQLT